MTTTGMANPGPGRFYSAGRIVGLSEIRAGMALCDGGDSSTPVHTAEVAEGHRALCRAHRDSERRSWAEARRRRIESERED